MDPNSEAQEATDDGTDDARSAPDIVPEIAGVCKIAVSQAWLVTFFLFLSLARNCREWDITEKLLLLTRWTTIAGRSAKNILLKVAQVARIPLFIALNNDKRM